MEQNASPGNPPAKPPPERGKGMAAALRRTFVTPIWGHPWPIWVGVVALAFANILMFAFARAVGVFPQLSMWGAQLYNLAGIDVDAPFLPYPLKLPHLDVHSMINFGLVLGVLAAAFLSREFKFRRDSWQGCLTGFVGGVLMGFGTVITPPCNVGGFYSATMALSLSGPLMAFGLLGGAWIGGTFLRKRAAKATLAMDFDAADDGVATPAAQPSKQPILGTLFIVLLFVVAAIYAGQGMTTHAGLLVFGAAFGIIFQRSRLCFAAAFRDILVSRNGTMMKWILLSVGIGTLAFAVLKSQGYKPDHFVLPAGLHTVIGGFIFGIGMVIAGGCGIGVLWRSAEGYMRAWCALLGGVLAAGSWVLIYGQHVGEGWLYGTGVFLPDTFGWVGSLVVVFGFLGVFYLFIIWLEARSCRS